jgi:hypothetical protein
MPRRPRGPARRHVVLRVSLRDIEPEIWRTVAVPEEFTLAQLHRVIQLVFGWLDYHLFEFRIGQRRFERADLEAEGEDAGAARLSGLRLTRGSHFEYTYDFGDTWEHEIVVERFVPVPEGEESDEDPHLLSGARAAPPEDAGGPPGYTRMLEALADPADPEHSDYREWVGEGFDPELFDLRAVDHALTLAAAWGAIRAKGG